MFKPSIKNRVMKIIKKKIEEAQKSYDQKCKQLDNELVAGIKLLRYENKDKKELEAKTLVDKIIGKIL